jgi:hypothetical protein
MRFLSSKFHGILDYGYSLLLIASPWMFNFSGGEKPQLIAIAAGLFVIFYSLLTNYELGVFRRIPMNMHLILDILVGIGLAASPWILGFDYWVYGPHLFFGLFAIVAGLITRVRPSFYRPIHA